MKTTIALIALGGCLLLPGCTSLLSLDPIVTASEATFDPALVGVWTEAKDHDMVIIRQSDEKTYAVAFCGKPSDTPVQFEGLLYKNGDLRIMDLAQKTDNDFLISGHSFVRIWLDGATLRWTFLDSDALKARVAEHSLVARKLGGGDRMLITAPGSAVRDFLVQFGTDDAAHGEVEELTLMR